VSLNGSEGLLDLDYGDWSGLSPTEAQTRFPLAYDAGLNAPDTVRFPHGEALSDVRTRAMDWVQRLTMTYPTDQVVLVTHLIVCRVLLCALLDLSVSHIWRFQVDTASLTVFDIYAGQASLITSNQTYHLR
jgi:phosphoserine phosphatase